MNIEELDLSVRAYNCLKRAKIDTVEQLSRFTKDDLLKTRNIGQKTADEIYEKVKEYYTCTFVPKGEQIKLDLVNASRLIRDWCASVGNCKDADCPFYTEPWCGIDVASAWELPGDKE